MAQAMKDSGIKWIGLVPKSWTMARLKRFAFVNNGKEIAEEINNCEDAIPVYGSGRVLKYACLMKLSKKKSLPVSTRKLPGLIL